jgi:hypothetical protein
MPRHSKCVNTYELLLMNREYENEEFIGLKR